MQFVFTRRQGADVNFAAQRDDSSGADACVSLGEALASARVDDVHGEGVTGEQGFVNAAEVHVQA